MERVRSYFVRVADRAVEAGAASAITALGADKVFNAVSVDFAELGGFFLGGALVSILVDLARNGIDGQES